MYLNSMATYSYSDDRFSLVAFNEYFKEQLKKNKFKPISKNGDILIENFGKIHVGGRERGNNCGKYIIELNASQCGWWFEEIDKNATGNSADKFRKDVAEIIEDMKTIKSKHSSNNSDGNQPVIEGTNMKSKSIKQSLMMNGRRTNMKRMVKSSVKKTQEVFDAAIRKAAEIVKFMNEDSEYFDQNDESDPNTQKLNKMNDELAHYETLLHDLPMDFDYGVLKDYIKNLLGEDYFYDYRCWSYLYDMVYDVSKNIAWNLNTWENDITSNRRTNMKRMVKSGYSNNPDYFGDWFGKGQIDFDAIINPEDDGDVWMVKLWSGSGYVLDVYLCKANDIYEAMNIVFEWSYENEGHNELVFDLDYVYDKAYDTYDEYVKHPDWFSYGDNLSKEDFVDSYIDDNYISNENYELFAYVENFFVDKVPDEVLAENRDSVQNSRKFKKGKSVKSNRKLIKSYGGFDEQNDCMVGLEISIDYDRLFEEFDESEVNRVTDDFEKFVENWFSNKIGHNPIEEFHDDFSYNVTYWVPKDEIKNDMDLFSWDEERNDDGDSWYYMNLNGSDLSFSGFGNNYENEELVDEVFVGASISVIVYDMNLIESSCKSIKSSVDSSTVADILKARKEVKEVEDRGDEVIAYLHKGYRDVDADRLADEVLGTIETKYDDFTWDYSPAWMDYSGDEYDDTYAVIIEKKGIESACHGKKKNKKKGKSVKSNRKQIKSGKFIKSGAGAAYDITIRGIELDDSNYKIISDEITDERYNEHTTVVEVPVKPCVVDEWIAESYYNGIDSNHEFFSSDDSRIEGGKAKLELMWYESEEGPFIADIEYSDADEAAQYCIPNSIDIKVTYGWGWIHGYLPNDEIHFDDKNGKYGLDEENDGNSYSTVEIDLICPNISQCINAFFENPEDYYPEDDYIESSRKPIKSSKDDKQKVKELWAEFENIPINDNDEIEKDFLHFEAGTDRFEIWKWFEQKFGVSIADDLMYDEREEIESSITRNHKNLDKIFK